MGRHLSSLYPRAWQWTEVAALHSLWERQTPGAGPVELGPPSVGAPADEACNPHSLWDRRKRRGHRTVRTLLRLGTLPFVQISAWCLHPGASRPVCTGSLQFGTHGELLALGLEIWPQPFFFSFCLSPGRDTASREQRPPRINGFMLRQATWQGAGHHPPDTDT